MRKLKSFGFLVTASMMTGFVLAMILSLGIFGGSKEHVITGSVSFGFAVGWLMLAYLTTRYSDQPQKWAYAPAVYFGVQGVLFLVLRPSNRLISDFGWLWPLILAGIVIWVVPQVKKQLHSRTRNFVIYPVLVILMFSAIGGLYEKIQESVDHNNLSIKGQLVDVGGYKMHINCVGEGEPTVILEPGLGEPSSAMNGWITPEIASKTRVCVYDREGRGWSDESPTPLDGEQTAEILHTLLAKSGISGPFVLAGHSAGGIYVLNYAISYPDEVVGIVLLDSMSPEQYEKLPTWPAFYDGFKKASALMSPLARLGVGRLAYGSAYGNFPEQVRSEQRAMWASPRLQRSQRDEFSVIRTALTRAQSLKSLDNTPLYVLTAQKDALEGWMTVQDQLADLSTNSKHDVLADATHDNMVGDEEFAKLSSQAILSVVNAVQTGKRLNE